MTLYLGGFRNRLRRDLSRTHRARGKLRLTREMDNFFCSHCCTSPCTLVRGALVLVAPARPAMSLDLFHSLLLDVGSFASTLAKMFLSIFRHFGVSVSIPIAKS